MDRQERKNPEFFCIGFQKSGTTTLFEILRQHGEVVLARDVKESMYYRVPLMRDIFGKKYYLFRYFGHFRDGETRRVGEVNAGLSYQKCAEKLGKDFKKDTKLIFMMRNPIDRSYSAYKYFLARGFLPGDVVRDDIKCGHAEAFDHYVHKVLESDRQREQIMKKRLKYLVLSQSNYGYCIREFLPFFQKDHMKFIVFEDFVRDMEECCKDVFAFLKVSGKADIDYDIHANEGSERPVSPFLAKAVQIAKGCQYIFCEFAAFDLWFPKGSRLVRSIYQKVRARGMAEDTDHGKLLPGTREYLRDYFREDVELAEQITGMDLKKVWKDFA